QTCCHQILQGSLSLIRNRVNLSFVQGRCSHRLCLLMRLIAQHHVLNRLYWRRWMNGRSVLSARQLPCHGHLWSLLRRTLSSWKERFLCPKLSLTAFCCVC